MTTTILVIDDSKDDQRLYQRAFKDFDFFFNLVEVSTADAGFAHLANNSPDTKRPDLILLDYNLPDMDGLSFMKRLSAGSDSSIPIVMLTGEDNATIAVEAMKHGAHDYLVKDTGGRYLRLLPGVVGRVMAAHVQRELSQQLQKKTEALLLRNQILMQNSMDGIHVMDMQGNIVEANDAFCLMLGYTKEEMARLNVADWDAQWSAEELQERFKWLIGKSARFETVHRRKDGSLIDVEISTSGMEIEGQGFLFASSRDITERKKIETVLTQHKHVLDTSIDGFWISDMVGNLLEANEAYAKMSGYTVAELVGMHISQLEAIELRLEDVQAHIAKVVAQGHERFETRHRHKDRHEIDVEISVTYMADPPRLVVFCRDITERKKAEAMLLNSEANLRAMLDNSPYLTWLKDSGGRYITINKVFADYLRLEDARQAIGKTDLELQPQELAEKYRADDAEVMASRQQRHVEESAFNGTATHWVETFKNPIIDERGNVLGTVGFARDITERKRSEEMLRESEANLKDIFENLRSGVAVYRASPDGQDFFFTSFNRAAERVEKVHREDVIGKNVAEVFPGVIEFGLLEVFRRVWQSGVEEHFPVSFYQDGRIAGWRENHIYKLPNGEIVAIYDDVTKEKQAAEEMMLENKAERARAEELAQQFGHLLQSSFNEIYMFDATSLKFILTSEGAEKNLGYVDEELNQLTPLDLKPSYTRESFEALIAPLRSGAQQTLLFETSHLRKNGTTYPVEIRLQLMEGSSPVFLAIVQDISKRKAAEERLRFHSNILKNLAEGILLIRADDGVIVFTNPQFENMFGYESGELFGKHVSIINAPSENTPEAVAREINEALARDDVWNGEVYNIKKDGTAFWCQASISTFEHSHFGKVWVSVHEDISKRKHAERQARELSAHLQNVREEEKASFAREIHDDLGGTLAALKMDAYWLARKLEADKEMEPLQACAQSMIGLLDTAVLATRRIITDLRPTLLDDLGLLEALKWQSTQFYTRTGIECRVICVEDENLEAGLDEAQLINLFRISQEALTNVARHSGASQVKIDLHQDGEEAVLSISDNGCGLPEGHSIASTSYGIRGMRERVMQLGGKIKFDTRPGGGFSVTVRLPLLAENRKMMSSS